MTNKEHLYCVILAGGIGRRFWPYSRKSYPKQFLDFFNTGESLLQMTCRRVEESLPIDHVFVCTNDLYSDIVHQQLPHLPLENILTEPNARNTGTTIARASMHLNARDPKAVVAITPSDHLVTDEDAFRDRIAHAFRHAISTDNIVTLGITPTYPEVGYGYIQAGNPTSDGLCLSQDACHKVKSFIEKPNREMAHILVESGEFYWNAGLFVAQTKVIINEVTIHAPEIAERLYANTEVWGTPKEEAFVREAYPYCPNISFDYAVMEKSQNVVMITAEMGWRDVGTWSSAYQVVSKDECGNASMGEHHQLFNDSHNNFVVMDDKEKLVVLQGVDDLLVVQRGNVLLITNKNETGKLRQVVAEVQNIDDKYVE